MYSIASPYAMARAISASRSPMGRLSGGWMSTGSPRSMVTARPALATPLDARELRFTHLRRAALVARDLDDQERQLALPEARSPVIDQHREDVPVCVAHRRVAAVALVPEDAGDC